MHQMFEEMTHHIQQQSDSHKYLEKLQIENEKLALQEKERQVLLCAHPLHLLLYASSNTLCINNCCPFEKCLCIYRGGYPYTSTFTFLCFIDTRFETGFCGFAEAEKTGRSSDRDVEV